MSDIQDRLRKKGFVEIDDIIVEYRGEWMLLQLGDIYIAQHDDDPIEILTVRKIEVKRRNSGVTTGKIFPKERNKRLYDLHEVVKVAVRKNPNPKKEQDNVAGLRDSNDAGGAGVDRQDARPAGGASGGRGEDRRGPRDPRKQGGRTDYSGQSVRSQQRDEAARRAPDRGPGLR